MKPKPIISIDTIRQTNFDYLHRAERFAKILCGNILFQSNRRKQRRALQVYKHIPLTDTVAKLDIPADVAFRETHRYRPWTSKSTEGNLEYKQTRHG